MLYVPFADDRDLRDHLMRVQGTMISSYRRVYTLSDFCHHINFVVWPYRASQGRMVVRAARSLFDCRYVERALDQCCITLRVLLLQMATALCHICMSLLLKWHSGGS